MPLPLHDVTTLTESFRRAVLRLFFRRDLMDVETAQDMLAWPHVVRHTTNNYDYSCLVLVHCFVEVVACSRRSVAPRRLGHAAGQWANGPASLVRDARSGVAAAGRRCRAGVAGAG